MRTQVVIMIFVLAAAASPGCMWKAESMSPSICEATGGPDELWLWVELEQRYTKPMMPIIGLNSIIPQMPVFGMYPEIYWTQGSYGPHLQEVLVLAPTGLKTRIPVAFVNGITFRYNRIYRFKNTFWLRCQENGDSQETIFQWAGDRFERLLPDKNDEFIKDPLGGAGIWHIADAIMERGGWRHLAIEHNHKSECDRLVWQGLRLKITWDSSEERTVLHIEAEDPSSGFEPVELTYLNGPSRMTDEERWAAKETPQDQRPYKKVDVGHK